jgi:anti-sigma regulatory factor (Ser/Thr protein kinase)
MPSVRSGAELNETLPPDPASVARARRMIWRFVADCEPGVDGEAAGLLTSELVTNAIRHAGTPVELLARVARGLRVEVTDGRPDVPLAPRDASGFSVSGRGLHLVDELASRWGVERDGATKTVWFELDGPLDDRRPDDRHPDGGR